MLDRETLEHLALLSPREMRRHVLNAFGNARLARRDQIKPDDIGGDRAKKRQRIGF